MLILEATFYIVPIFVELESAIFYVCSLHYYLISAFLVFGYLRLFYKLFNLLLIQFESPLIPNEQKSEVKSMTLKIGLLFLLIIQRNVFEIVNFTKYNLDGVHMPSLIDQSLGYVILSFISVGGLITSYLITINMVMKQQKGVGSNARDSASKSKSLGLYDNEEKEIVLDVESVDEKITSPSK